MVWFLRGKRKKTEEKINKHELKFVHGPKQKKPQPSLKLDPN